MYIGEVKKRSSRKRVFFILFLLILGFGSWYFHWFNVVENTIWLVTEPVHVLVRSSFQDILKNIQGWAHAKDIIRENEILKIERGSLLARLVKLEELEKENGILRKTLELESRTAYQLASARVVGFQRNEIGETLRVIFVKPLHSLVRVGNPVIIENNALVGKVTNITATLADVMLVSDPHMVFAAKILHNDAEGIAYGTGSDSLKLEQIEPSFLLERNDIVVTSVLGGKFPEGLLAGKIEQVFEPDYTKTKSATMSILFNPKFLETVYIITDFPLEN